MPKIIKFVFSLKNQKKKLLSILFIFFLIALTLARAYAVYVGNSIFIEGFQIHHFYFGMFCLSVGGVIALLSNDNKVRYFASALMGIGLGLFVDEIGLLLNCTTRDHACSYSFPDTFDIFGVAIVAILALIFLIDLADRYQERKKQLQ